MVIKSVDYHSPNIAAEFAKSLHETGFGILKHHPLPWGQIEEAYSEWTRFFNSDAKLQYPYDPDKQDGYVPPELSEIAKGSDKKDIKEFYHLYFPWGRYPKEINNVSRRLFYQKFELAVKLLNWIEEYLPDDIRAKLSCPLRDMICEERSAYRVLHYPAMTGAEEPGAIRAGAHGDINLLTVLPAATQAGLQVLDKNNNWVDVPVEPESLVINIGDMLSEATDGYYRSTVHRVINPEGEDARSARLSMPLFLHAKADVKISDRYPTAEGFLRERLRELGLNK